MCQNKNPDSKRHFEHMQNPFQENVEFSKQKYYPKLSRKLATNKINPKCYWSILKSFLNSKKSPFIPPLIKNNQLAIDFREKDELFNKFFA